MGRRLLRAARGFKWSDMKEQGQPWTATCFSLSQLREFGLDQCSERARQTVKLVGENARWDEGGQPFWEGETEECINGRTVADGAYFGVDVSAIVQRLLGERMDDGGWNCEREKGSVRSSFDSTINVLEGLLEFERATGGTADSVQARRSGEEYLLKRHLFRRLTTGRARPTRSTCSSCTPSRVALRRPAGSRLLPQRLAADGARCPTHDSRRPSTTSRSKRLEDGK